MARNCYRNIIFFQLFGCLAWLTITSVYADGRVFLLETANLTNVASEGSAQRACESQGARLASADELRHAVTECSFSACARGRLAGSSIGTTVCSGVGGGVQAVKVVDVKVENATAPGGQLHAFCVKDKGDPCGDPPSFPHTTLQGHTGFEMGDELLYACIPGYVMPNGQTAFSLLCDSCGEWYGLVQLCVKDEKEAHIDYEDKFPDETHVSFADAEEEHEEDHEEVHLGDRTLEGAEGGEHDGVDHEGVEHEDVTHVGVVHVDYEGMEQEGVAHDGIDYEGREQEGLAQEDMEQYSVSHEGIEQDGVLHEGVDQEGAEQEPGYQPGEEVPVTEEEQQEEERVGVSREVTEGQVEEVEDSTDRVSQQPTTVTDAPVSLLSQKHLFWFPSQTWGAEDTREPVTPARGGDHTGVKTSVVDTEGTTALQQPHDLPVGVPSKEPQNDTREAAGESVASSDESWLDGYPITQEAEMDGEDSEKVGGGSTEAEGEEEGEEEEDIRQATDSPNHVEIGQPGDSPSTPSTDFTQIVASPTRPVDYGIKHVPMVLTPTSAPENVSSSVEDAGLEITTTPSVVEEADTTPVAAALPDSGIRDRGATVAPTAFWATTESLYPFIDHLPGPTEQEEVTAPYQEPQESATGLPDEFAGVPGLYDERTESNLTHEGTGAKLLPTEEPCVGDACPSGTGRGPLIAIIIVAICALVTAAAVAVWCYKKRQQKSSVYKMNGKGQSRHPQQIEMQQKV
ncbi:hypothetical protein MATL_G00231410 [Megalops atlanticus]|uniref:Sushi domain-containing protein 5 n=1 Tax=Megalops atlanticus TaxID=7932 RepID=A0A9D3PF63_MEGAT|nr:hypothetical protein MATL_G00231410 [Megalops atlanticus]